MKLVTAGRRFPGTHIQSPQRRKVRAQARRSDLKHPQRDWQVPQPSRPQVGEVDSAEQTRRRLGHEHLASVPGSHHPRRAIQHRSEVVAVAQLCLTGRDAHPHRQLQRPLCSDRSINRRARRRERGNHAVTGVPEQKTVVRLDRGAQHLVMRPKGRPHRRRVNSTGRGRDLG